MRLTFQLAEGVQYHPAAQFKIIDMPFKKGNQTGNTWKKGQSGNPNGQPRKLATQLKIIGYTKAEAANTINAMLAMNINELKEIFENPNATILEKTIASALKRSLEKGSLYSVDTLLDRTHGKATEIVESKVHIEQPFFPD